MITAKKVAEIVDKCVERVNEIFRFDPSFRRLAEEWNNELGVDPISDKPNLLLLQYSRADIVAHALRMGRLDLVLRTYSMMDAVDFYYRICLIDELSQLLGEENEPNEARSQ